MILESFEVRRACSPGYVYLTKHNLVEIQVELATGACLVFFENPHELGYGSIPTVLKAVTEAHKYFEKYDCKNLTKEELDYVKSQL